MLAPTSQRASVKSNMKDQYLGKRKDRVDIPKKENHSHHLVFQAKDNNVQIKKQNWFKILITEGQYWSWASKKNAVWVVEQKKYINHRLFI